MKNFRLKMIGASLFLAFSMTVASCAEAGQGSDAPKPRMLGIEGVEAEYILSTNGSYTAVRIEDHSNGIVCYMPYTTGGGIACFRMEESNGTR